MRSWYFRIGYFANSELGNFACCFCRLPIFFSKSTLKKNQGYHRSVKRVGYRSGPNVIKLIPCSTQLSTKFILLINVKMPTIVGILTFISRINTTSERLKARNFFICRYFSFYDKLKFRTQLSWAWKMFYNLGSKPDVFSGSKLFAKSYLAHCQRGLRITFENSLNPE